MRNIVFEMVIDGSEPIVVYGMEDDSNDPIDMIVVNDVIDIDCSGDMIALLKSDGSIDLYGSVYEAVD